MRAARAFNWLIEWPCEKSTAIIRQYYLNLSRLQGHTTPSPSTMDCLSCRWLSMPVLSVEDARRDSQGEGLDYLYLTIDKSSLNYWMMDAFFLTFHNQILNHRDEIIYKLQNVTRYCMSFSYFDDLTRSPYSMSVSHPSLIRCQFNLVLTHGH